MSFPFYSLKKKTSQANKVRCQQFQVLKGLIEDQQTSIFLEKIIQFLKQIFQNYIQSLNFHFRPLINSYHLYLSLGISMDPATKLVLIVSLHFMILFTAFNAFQTIETRIHQQEGDHKLGPFRFAVNYSAFVLSNLFVSRVKFSQKWQITFATLTYAFHYMTGFLISGTPMYTKYLVIALGAIVNGFGASFLWTGLGSYIHKICHLHNKTKEKGHYYGLFNTIYCFSSIFGAVIVTFGLSLFSHNVYFMIVTGVALLAFFFGLIFIQDIKITQETNSLEQPGFLKRSCQSAKSTIRFYPKMKYTLGLIVLDGLNLGVITSTMLHLLPSLDNKKENTLNAGLTLIVSGFGCVIGGYLGGRVCDKLRIRLSSTILLYFYFVSSLFSIFASLIMQIWSAMIACFIWGFVIYYLSANLQVICSRIYEGRPQSFAIVKQFHSIVFVIYQIVALGTNNQLPVSYIMYVLIVAGVAAMWGIHKTPEESIPQNQLMEEQNKSSDKLDKNSIMTHQN